MGHSSNAPWLNRKKLILPWSTVATTIVFFPCFRAANGWGFRRAGNSEDGEPKKVGKKHWKKVSLGRDVEFVAVLAFEEGWIVIDFPS